jgi:N6-adenosine-specific RNA methylase IME4
MTAGGAALARAASSSEPEIGQSANGAIRGPAPTAGCRDFIVRIAASWRRTREAAIETGRLLLDAKQALPHGEFGAMIDGWLPFGRRWAQHLMAIAGDARLSNAKHASLLPASAETLYELTRLDDESFARRIGDGTISPDMRRADIATVVMQEHRRKREAELGARQYALPDKKFGVVYADPEWSFEFWGEPGLRGPDNHYPTSPLEAIRARDVASIAADDAVLFLWTTAPRLGDAFATIEAWGFRYRSNFIWEKDRISTGYWNRNKHEQLLIGARGQIPCPAPGTQWDSLLEAPAGEHSVKPDLFYELIEAYFPNLPKIELNARRPRDGWAAWGDEAGWAA